MIKGRRGDGEDGRLNEEAELHCWEGDTMVCTVRERDVGGGFTKRQERDGKSRERERRWFVLERPRRDTNGGSETEVTVTSKRPQPFPGTVRMMMAMKKKEQAGVQLEKDRERTLGLPVTSPAPPRSAKQRRVCCDAGGMYVAPLRGQAN